MYHFVFQPVLAAGMFPSLLFIFVEIGCGHGVLLVQTASINVDCRKAERLECFISCIIGCHTPARVVKEDEESRSGPHGTPKHNPELCSRIAHYSTARNRHFWRDTTDTLPGSLQDRD